MLSIRNMLTDTATKETNRPSVLNISYLLCPSDKHDLWTDINYNQHLNDHFKKSNLKEKQLIEQEFYHRRRSTSSSCSSSSCSSPITSYHSPPIKAKRRRASTKQLDVLNRVFEKTFFPSTQLRAELGRQLGMSPRTVQIWFQNRRQAIRTKERTSSSVL
ncbi:Homeodomain-like protein [Choanephora cucurbitarum]|nr:Homeodomain-like protein [Choanephora cucurbitarum]